MYYIVLDIFIERRFLKNGCYSQQIISVVAKEPLIPYNHAIPLHKEHQKQKTFNTVTPNFNPNQIKQM